MSSTLPIDRQEAARLADEFEQRPAEDVLRWAAGRFAGRVVMTCSWQKQSSVLVHMLSEVAPDVPVVEFDTGLLFPETYETRDRLMSRYPINFTRIDPELTVDEQAETHGDRLWERDPDACCGIRKVAPLTRALEGMDAWVTGIRREQSTTRHNARKIEVDERRGVVKVQPLADWTSRDVWRYIWRHSIPYNSLHDHGYPSIGCIPCTTSVTGAAADERSGRWRGTGKLECGLHGNG
ncbi:MAG TPA: phosphoadenylyl-sulfate reductase [Gaiellales bacterium]|jgi:phosphoadenosine phosphosulfate reductase|nr:phosphoadenylyl-sulfate reductase [Gaiellales bacterium]